MALTSSSSFSAAFLPWGRPLTSTTHTLPLTVRSVLSPKSHLLQAARFTVDSFVQSGMLVGLGSGDASGLAIHYLGQQLKAGVLKEISGIPTCVGSASEAAKAGIPLKNLEGRSKIDIAICDADAIEEETLCAIIGRRKIMGEESIIYEKTILGNAKKLVFIVNELQYRSGLDGAIPVFIQPFNWMETAEEIDDLFLGDAEVWRRPAIGHADPLGGDFPVVTKEGHNVLDVIFTSPITSLAKVADTLDQVDGVIDHGIICRAPCTAVISSEMGLQVIDNYAMFEVERA